METKEQYLLEAKNLSKYFPVKNFFGKLVQEVRAVDRVNLSIKKGETFGLVGESGCGESTLGRTLIRMYEPTDGILTYDGHDITKTKGKELLAYHKRMQIIFQDPYSALDPHQNVREIMAEPIAVFEKLPEKEMDERIVSLLEKVGMKADDMEKYAYEFSGGQRQRIGIARALSVNPEFLLCDEPISALDVSIQAQVVNVLEDLQQELGLTYLFVAHDLSMVRHISDRIGVMYLGKIVESGESDEVYDNPCHPYTRALLASIPIADPKRALSLEHCGIEGDLPSPLHVPSGCRFHTRCPYATDQCRQQEPELEVSCRNCSGLLGRCRGRARKLGTVPNIPCRHDRRKETTFVKRLEESSRSCIRVGGGLDYEAGISISVAGRSDTDSCNRMGAGGGDPCGYAVMSWYGRIYRPI